MLQAFNDIIEEELTFLKKGRLLLAVSGGIDSVVMTHLCCQSHLDLSLAHCNFELRGEESEQDEAFVLELGDQLGLEVFVQRFNTQQYMRSHAVSLQMAARELRYQWFQELSTQLKFDYILTAHHADDNLETLLINFSRGTGLNGLTGIPMINDNIVRPLLSFSRQEILALAESQGWQWREDASNSSRKYLRNKLRHEVIPILKEINSNLLSSFQETTRNLNDIADIVDESLNAVAKRAITHIDEHEVHYKISEFKKVNNSRAYMHEMFKAYGFKEWQDVVDLLDAQSGKYVKSNTHRLIKHREVLILTAAKPPTYLSILVDDKQNSIDFSLGTLILERVSELGVTDQSSVFLDLEALSFPLHLRIWKKGDFFVPSGMTGKKKLSKYFKDEKYSLTEKERSYVLSSGDDIVWIVGKRADHRFLATKQSTDILKIELRF